MDREIAGFSFDEWPRLIGLLTVLVFVVGALMAAAGKAMTSKGGAGIVAFELAEDSTQAQSILDTWGPEGRAAATRSLVLDYLWIVAYVSAIGLACLYVAGICEQLGWEVASATGTLLAGLALVAGTFDAIENTALLRQLATGPTVVSVQVARTCAQIKFTLIGACLFYVAAMRSAAWLVGT